MAKKKRSRKMVVFKTDDWLARPEEVAEHLASLDGESDYETEARVAGQIARLGARLIKSIKAEEMKNPPNALKIGNALYGTSNMGYGGLGPKKQD